MSQAGSITGGGGPTPPPNFTLTGESGVATSVGGNINVPGGQSTADFSNGVTSTGAADNLTVILTNRVPGTLTTTDATPGTLVSFNLGATPAAYVFRGSVIGFVPATGDAGGYNFEGTYTTDGATSNIVGGQFSSFQETAGFSAADVFITDGGNTLTVEVTGIAATTINWKALFTYTRVT